MTTDPTAGPQIVSGDYDEAAAHHDAMLREIESLRVQLAEAREALVRVANSLRTYTRLTESSRQERKGKKGTRARARRTTPARLPRRRRRRALRRLPTAAGEQSPQPRRRPRRLTREETTR